MILKLFFPYQCLSRPFQCCSQDATSAALCCLRDGVLAPLSLPLYSCRPAQPFALTLGAHSAATAPTALRGSTQRLPAVFLYIFRFMKITHHNVQRSQILTLPADPGNYQDGLSNTPVSKARQRATRLPSFPLKQFRICQPWASGFVQANLETHE